MGGSSKEIKPITKGVGKSLRTTLRNCKGDICQCLLDKIDELAFSEKGVTGSIKGLDTRFREQVAVGAQGPGTTSWKNHGAEILNQQKALREHIQEYDARGCGKDLDKPDVSYAARELSNRDLPGQADWEYNNLQVIPLEEPDWGVLPFAGQDWGVLPIEGGIIHKEL